MPNVEKLDFDKATFDSVLTNAANKPNVVIASNFAVRAPYGPLKNRFYCVLNFMLRAVSFGKKGVGTTFPEKSMKAVAEKIQSHPALFQKPANVVNMHTVLQRYVQKATNPKIKSRLENLLLKCNLQVKDAEKTLAFEDLNKTSELMSQISTPGAANTILKALGRILEHCSKEDLANKDLANKDSQVTGNLCELVGRFGNAEMTKNLLAKSADVASTKERILRNCIVGKNLSLFEELYKDSISGNLREGFLQTVTISDLVNFPEAVKFLVDKNELRFESTSSHPSNLALSLLASAKATDDQKLKPIVISMLDKDPTLINETNEAGFSLLHYGVIKGLPEITAELIARGSKLGCKAVTGATPVNVAIKLKAIEKDSKEARTAAALLIIKAGDKDLWVDEGLVSATDKDTATIESVTSKFLELIQ